MLRCSAVLISLLYSNIAAAQFASFERILLPVMYVNVPGAYGSVWTSEVTMHNGAKETLKKSGFRDAVENVVVVDTSSTLNGGDESGETADVRRVGVAEQREEDAA